MVMTRDRADQYDKEEAAAPPPLQRKCCFQISIDTNIYMIILTSIFFLVVFLSLSFLSERLEDEVSEP